jgi:hypothetical protein
MVQSGFAFLKLSTFGDLVGLISLKFAFAEAPSKIMNRVRCFDKR